jgi:hypothetical protein
MVMKVLVQIMLAVALFPALAASQDCIYYENYLHWVGEIQLSSAYDMAVSGNFAYIADADEGLVVVDITDPSNPRMAGSVNTPGSAFGVAVLGGYAYVIVPYSGLQVIDITNPESPQIVGSVDSTGPQVWRIAVSGSYAYVGDFYSLDVIDVTDPKNPFIVGSVDTPDGFQDIAVSGSYAYLAVGDGLQVIDVTDPTNPIISGSVETPGGAYGVAVVGSYAYLATNTGWPAPVVGSLQIIDIADPNDPQIIHSVVTPGEVFDVAVLDSYTYLAVRGVGLMVVDVSNWVDQPVAGIVQADVDWHASVAVLGNYAYIADPCSHIGDPSSLQVINISDPGNVSIIGSINTPGDAREVAVKGNYAYVGACESGLQVVDISNPTSPLLVGSVGTFDRTMDVAIAGSYAFLATSPTWPDTINGSIQVIDIANPFSPQLVRSVDTPGYPQGIAIAGSFAYVAWGDSGLQVIDITDPLIPNRIGSVSTLGYSWDVAIAGSYAFVASTSPTWPDPNVDGNLQIIDITNPQNPQLVGNVGVPGGANNVVVSGSCAYVAGGNLHVIDISDPEFPQITGSVGSMYAFDLTVSGSYAYVCNCLPSPSFGHAPLFHLQVFDIDDPEHPQHIGGVDIEGLGVAVSGGNVVVASDGFGLQILPAQCGQVVAIEDDLEDIEPTEEIPHIGPSLTIHPNPFNPQTTISFSLERTEWAEIGVYDLGSRLLIVLANHTYDTGHHSVVWQGKDALGRAVPSGSYIIRLKTESGVETSKVSLIR